MICELCESASGIYNFKDPCCIARFISNQPTLAQRRGWIKRLNLTTKDTLEVEALLKMIWGQKKSCTATKKSQTEKKNSTES